MTDTPAPPPTRPVALLIAAVLALVGLGVVWLRLRPAADKSTPEATAETGELPPDPRLTYTGPFRNVRPEAGYVGDARCAVCHVDIAAAYAQHPMGCSMVTARDLAGRQRYDAAVNNPFDAVGRRLRVEREGDRLFHTVAVVREGKPVVTARHEVRYAVGSGTRGYSYLTEQDGYVFQTSISWFSQKGIWDLSPGFVNVPMPGRPVIPSCLQCHADQPTPRPGYAIRYEPDAAIGRSIGCERCHGPGEAHVAARERGDPLEVPYDTSTVNPRHLSAALRDNVCEQCHLNGQARLPRRGRGWLDYRPGLPLESFLAVFVAASPRPGENKAVTHVEQMRRSACYRRSPDANKLGCVSCHDPHEKPAAGERVRYFRDRCLACHRTQGCSLPVADRVAKVKDDSCIDCHMPRAGSDIVHTALTDHHILRPGAASPAPPEPTPDNLPVRNFYADRLAPDDPEARRDLGVALMQMLELGRVPPPQTATAQTRGQALLQAALERAPNDPAGWLAYGDLLMRDGYGREAIRVLERAERQAPNSEYVLSRLAHLEGQRGGLDAAGGYLRRLVEVNPFEPIYRRSLALYLGRQKDWEGVGGQAEAWLRLDPFSSEARQLQVMSLLQRGRKDEAARAFETLRQLRPGNLAELEEWYARLSR